MNILNKHIAHFKVALSTLREIYKHKFNYIGQIAIYSGFPLRNEKCDGIYPFLSDMNFFYFIPINIDGIVLLIDEFNKPKVIFKKKSQLWETYDYSLIYDLQDEGLIDIIDNLNPESFVKRETLDGRLTVCPNRFLQQMGLDIINFDIDLLVTLTSMRASKTEYEIDCIKKSTEVSLKSFEKAKNLFFENEQISETNLFYAFSLEGNVHPQRDFIYYPIVGLNNNISILHYHDQSSNLVEANSLLIDAGIGYKGYTADITRTYSKDNEFNIFINKITAVKDEIAKYVKPGITHDELNNIKDKLLANVLIKEKLIIYLSEEDILKENILRFFNNHLVGHPLGLGVHDLHIYRRNSVASPRDYFKIGQDLHYSYGSVFTIEPGLYFNKFLAEELRQSIFTNNVNWSKFNKFIEYGGVRIEDNYFIDSKGNCINITSEN